MTDAPDHRSVVDEVAEDLRDNGYVVTTSQALDRMTIYTESAAGSSGSGCTWESSSWP